MVSPRSGIALVFAGLLSLTAVLVWVLRTPEPFLREQLKTLQYWSLETCVVLGLALCAVLARDVLRGLDRGLMLDPAQRPQSVDAWLAEMPSLAGAAPVAGSAEPGAAAERRPVNRRAVLALAGGAALAGTAGWILLSRSDISGSARPLRVDWAKAYDPVGPFGVKPAVAIAGDGGAFVVASVSIPSTPWTWTSMNPGTSRCPRTSCQSSPDRPMVPGRTSAITPSSRTSDPGSSMGSTITFIRDRSALFTSNDGFSVVAPTRTTVPSST